MTYIAKYRKISLHPLTLTSQITGNPTVFSTARPNQQQWEHQSYALLAPCEDVNIGSPYKGAVIWKSFLSWRHRECLKSLRAIPDNELTISRAFSRSKVIGSTLIRHRSDTEDSHVLQNGCSLLRGVWYHLSNATVYIHSNGSTFIMLFPIPRYIEPRYRKPLVLTSMTPDDDFPWLFPAL